MTKTAPSYVFVTSRRKDGRVVFSAPLKKRRCKARGCELSVSIGRPYCRRHLISHLGLVIGESDLLRKYKGIVTNGVFACRDFCKGDVVAHYSCERATESDLDTRYGGLTDTLHAYSLDDGVASNKSSRYLDAALDRCVASMINDSYGLPRARRLENCTFCENSNAVEATRNIAAGEELFVSYGADYWHSYEGSLFNFDTYEIEEEAEPAAKPATT